MRHTTLFVRVGRAEPKPLCSVDEDSPSFESQLSAQENRTMSDLIAGGNDLARVEFFRESSGEISTPVSKKGGRK